MLQHRLELSEAVGCARFRVVCRRQRARQCVRIWSDVHLREERAVAASVLRLRGRERGRTDRAPVESAAEGDDRLPACRLTGELDRPFDRFRAAVSEEHRVQPLRCDGGELLSQRDVRFVLRDAGGDVHEPLRLIDHGLHDARMRVPHHRHGDPAGHVEHAPAVGRDEPTPLAPLDGEPGVVAEDRRKDFASARFEVRHRVHSIGYRSVGARSARPALVSV